MVKQVNIIDEVLPIRLSLKFLLCYCFAFKLAVNVTGTVITNKTTNHSCYTCVEPLVGYTDHAGSCRFLNLNSAASSPYVKDCSSENNYNGDYECRKLVISFRSIETHLRRDCAPKGLCSWKDKTQSMKNTPVSNCVYTDTDEEKLECIYCCDTPLCNHAILPYGSKLIIFGLSLIQLWNKNKF